MNMVPLRIAAVAIAIMAAVDPSITSSRPSRPIVSVIKASTEDVVLADRVAAALAPRFTVVRGRLDGAAGVVLAGASLPDESVAWPGLVAAVEPTAQSPQVSIVSLDAPHDAPLNARVPVRASVNVTGGRGRILNVALRSEQGEVDTAAVVVEADSAIVPVDLTFIPSSASAARLTTVATIAGSASADSATILVELRTERYSVLFFDPRASWSSTFVRRALEQDPRFVVTSRVRTSRGVSNVSGSPPASLVDAVPDDYATIIVGSPDQLNAADMRALETFMRERGGRVVVLLDGRVTANINQLTGVTAWSSVRLESAIALADSSGSGPLHARELAWPTRNPAGISTHAWSVSSDSTVRTILWSVPVGPGRLFVSGAIDAWHYRDPAMSRFDAFWPRILADLSASAPRPVEVALSRRVLVPGQETTVRVSARSSAMDATRSLSVRAMLTNGTESTFVRLWPATERGTMEGTVVAPATPGSYRLIVTAGSTTESKSFVVDSVANPARADEPDIIAAFVSSRSGFTIGESRLQSLSERLAAAFEPVSRVETWYPMRSAWWLLPFTAFLGAEWWWRRRRGLA